MKKLSLPPALLKYQGVLYFIVVLLTSHFFWKFTMKGDESDDAVTFFGIDLTPGFEAASTHVAITTAFFLDLTGFDVTLNKDNVIRHTNGNAVKIVWACTGLKQAYIFFCIIAFYAGPWKRKLWYIPAGLVVVYLFNIFRITYISAAMKDHPEQFDLLHLYIFKYLYYGVIFLMWVLWEEKIRIKSQESRVKSQESRVKNKD